MNYEVYPFRAPQNIAVVGSGIAGLSTAWLLSGKHTVTVYELENRLGGHSNTVDVQIDHTLQPVDTGFIVYNEENYPNLVALFDYLGVQTESSQMSFAVSLDEGSFEFGSRNLNSILGQRSNIFRARFLNMFWDVRRFYREGREFLLNSPSCYDMTLGNFLTERSYNGDFVERFILPMGAAIWSTSPELMRDQPALTFLKFFASHGLLRFFNRIPWRTVTGGSREYVRHLTADYGERLRLNGGVRSISRHTGRVKIIDGYGVSHDHDAVVVATHADQALKMLADPDGLERRLLSAFRYNKNDVVLHSDADLMPKRRNLWSSWNFMGDTDGGVSVTYWMNSLQSIDRKIQLYLSVNPKKEPNPLHVHKSLVYEHPIFDSNSWRAQENLWKLQGRRNTWFCGSYFGYGFHEDALQSGLAVAEELGGTKRPWSVEGDSSRIYRNARAGLVLQ